MTGAAIAAIGPTRREDRSIGSNRRRWAAIVPRRTPPRRRPAKRGRSGLNVAQARGPVRWREMAKQQKARGAGEATVPRARSSSERERLEAAVASLSSLNADQLRLQWRNHLGGIPPAHLPGWLLARVLAYRIHGLGIRRSRSGDLAPPARDEGRSSRVRTSSSLWDPRTDNARRRRAQVGGSPRPSASWSLTGVSLEWRRLPRPLASGQGDHRHELERTPLLRAERRQERHLGEKRNRRADSLLTLCWVSAVSVQALPSCGPGNGILRAETGGRIQAQSAGERPEFGSQTGPRLTNLRELRGFLSPGKPGRFARTAWWWTQSRETSLRRTSSLLTGKRTGKSPPGAAEEAEGGRLML